MKLGLKQNSYVKKFFNSDLKNVFFKKKKDDVDIEITSLLLGLWK